MISYMGLYLRVSDEIIAPFYYGGKDAKGSPHY